MRQPSFGTQQRIERALAQRLYLLKAVRHEVADGATFAVLGSTQNVYTVVFDQFPRCDCPDFAKGQGLCKHVLFIWLRVLRCSEDDHRIWQKALLREELTSAITPLFVRQARRLPLATKALREAYARAAEAPSASAESTGTDTEASQRCRQALECEDCAICFETMTTGEDEHGLITFCCACGNNFHTECMRRWQGASAGGGCPLCREPWTLPTRTVRPGEPLPKPTAQASLGRAGSFSDGPYLNLATLTREERR